MPLALVRHTTPALAAGVCYGRLDVGLAETFDEEAARILAALPPVDRLLSSPAGRCRRLACWLGERLALAPAFDPRLQELDFGRWEGRRWDDIPRAELDLWATDLHHARPHGGESVAMLARRVGDALADLARTRETSLVVTHAGVIRAALAASGDATGWRAPIPYGAVVVLGGTGGEVSAEGGPPAASSQPLPRQRPQ